MPISAISIKLNQRTEEVRQINVAVKELRKHQAESFCSPLYFFFTSRTSPLHLTMQTSPVHLVHSQCVKHQPLCQTSASVSDISQSLRHQPVCQTSASVSDISQSLRHQLVCRSKLSRYLCFFVTKLLLHFSF